MRLLLYASFLTLTLFVLSWGWREGVNIRSIDIYPGVGGSGRGNSQTYLSFDEGVGGWVVTVGART